MEPDGELGRRFWRRGLTVVLCVALAGRLGSALLLPHVVLPDEGTYGQLSDALLDRGELCDRGGNRAMVGPGYPLFLAGCRVVFGDSVMAVRLPQALLGLLTVLAVALIARKLWGDAAALAAGALAAIDPFAVYFGTLVLSETAALCLLCLSALAALEGRRRYWAAAASGVLAGLCVLVRPGWLTTLALLVATALVCSPPAFSARRRWVSLGLAALAFCVVMSPWWVRNWSVFGRFVPLSTAGGQSLYEGNSERATGAPDVLGTVGVLIRDCAGLDELDRDRLLKEEARRWIRAHPAEFARLAAVKFARTWSPVPNEPSHRRWHHMLASAADWLTVLLLAAAALALKRRSAPRRLLWCLLPTAAVVAGHLFIVGSVRYRMPAWPFLEILAGVALAEFLRRLRRPASEPQQ